MHVNSFAVGDRRIGDGRTFVIAEVGSNHGGDLSCAKEHMVAAREAGADAVKFQSIRLDKLYLAPSEEIRELHSRIDMPEEWHAELDAHGRRIGIPFFSSPTYLDAVVLLDRLEIPLFKIASAQVGTFPRLIEAVARTGRPALLSTGISGYRETSRAVELFELAGNRQYAVLHCNSLYPTPPDRVHLGRMETYRRMFGCPVGFSDHTSGISVPLGAVALGAAVVEKHFCLDSVRDTPDAAFSIGPGRFAELVKGIRAVEAARDGAPRVDVEPAEARFRDAIRYRLILRNAKRPGETIALDELDYLRDASGIDAAKDVDVARGYEAARNLAAGHLLTWTDLRVRR